MNNIPRPDCFPGKKLEDYILWDLQMLIDIEHENPSLYNKQLASFILEPVIVTKEQFQIILALFEPYRCEVEQCLDKFDTTENSFISYAQFEMVFIPSEVYYAVHQLLLNNFLK